MKPINSNPIRAWTARFGQFPGDYLSLDVETSGLDLIKDRILQFGIVIVKNRKPVLSKTIVVDWTRCLNDEELEDLRIRMERTRVVMHGLDKPYPWTFDLLASRGELPIPIAMNLQATFGETPFCIGHNSWNFDYPRIFKFLKDYGAGFDTYRENLYDTCQMTRACFANRSIRPAEDIADYYKDLLALRGLPKATLEACVDFFELEKQGVDLEQGHKSADYDAWASHLIFERHRRLANAAN